MSSFSQEIQDKVKERLGDDVSGQDAYLRYILSTLENMEYLSLRNINNLTNIDFVEYMTNLVQLDIVGTSVTNLKILEDLTNGGGLLRFASLSIDNSSTNLVDIQNTINNFYQREGCYWNSYFGSRGSGLNIWTKNLFDKLNLCSELENLKLYGSNNDSLWATIAGDLDLSNMARLKNLSFLAVYKVVQLPGALDSFYAEHSCFPCFSTGTHLGYLSMGNSHVGTLEQLNNMYESLKNFNKIDTVAINYSSQLASIGKISKLRNVFVSKITFIPHEGLKNKSFDISDFSNFSGGKGSIYDFSISDVSLVSLPDFSGTNVSKLSLIRTQLEDINGLENCENLLELTLTDNKIQNLRPLKNLEKLEKLYISNNNIYNTFKNSINNEIIDNLQVLIDLHGKSLTTLNISGNHLEVTGGSSDSLERLKELFGANGDFSNQI